MSEPNLNDPLTGQPFPTLETALAAPRLLTVDPKGQYRTIAAAIVDATPNNTTILLSAGAHELNERNRLPEGVSLVGYAGWGGRKGQGNNQGHGQGQGGKKARTSHIVNRYQSDMSPNGKSIGIVPGDRSYIGYFSAENVPQYPDHTQMLIGGTVYSGDASFNGVRIQKVTAKCDTDIWFLMHNEVCSGLLDDDDFTTAWDNFVQRGGRENRGVTHQFTINRCKLTARGPSVIQPNNNANGLTIDAGRLEVHNSVISASGAQPVYGMDPQNTGLLLLNNSAPVGLGPEVHVWDTTIEATTQPYIRQPNCRLFIQGHEVTD